jgi:hypothetical protein
MLLSLQLLIHSCHLIVLRMIVIYRWYKTAGASLIVIMAVNIMSPHGGVIVDYLFMAPLRRTVSVLLYCNISSSLLLSCWIHQHRIACHDCCYASLAACLAYITD